MRRYIDIIQALNEKWDATLENGTEVFRNPTGSEFAKLMRYMDGEARLSFCRNGDVLVFDGNMTTHEDVRHHNFDIDGEFPTAMVGVRPNHSTYLMLHHAYSFADDYINELGPILAQNPNLVRMLGRDFDVLAETHDGDTVNLAHGPYQSQKEGAELEESKKKKKHKHKKRSTFFGYLYGNPWGSGAGPDSCHDGGGDSGGDGGGGE